MLRSYVAILKTNLTPHILIILFYKDGDEENDEENATEESKLIRRKTNLNLMKKLENTSEALNILVGQASTLDDQLCIFIRLKEGVVLGELTEVAIPSRFIFILIGPAVSRLC